ncbi:MAG: phenylalanine--tRNA ligase subunit alpha [Bacteriovoracaceae bacterium]|nr:phenylalanine--tRNA ligase subunit alpha [Bacteriovoracaceae bacterium]
MIEKLDELFKKFKKELDTVASNADALNLKAQYLGKKGPISNILRSLKDATASERKVVGASANELKVSIQDLINDKINSIEMDLMNKKLESQRIDISDRQSIRANSMLYSGGFHPINLVQNEIEDIFLSMGFEVLDGPHIEDEYHNFEALNIPADHPARDMQDTFWFEPPDPEASNRHLLRCHTSTIQVRGMKDRKPPFRFIAPGKVFRCERTDASHESAFHQLEGMLVGENISVANLIYFMKTLLSEIFKKEVQVRLRPGFFPFVEPGFELDIQCLICKGKGCSVCKKVGWVELLPCGMVHPNVLKAGGIDTSKYNGFAFGLGLDRLVMMRYGIDDIRLIHSGDLRFISQFKSY